MKLATCHPNRKHKARGLCAPCYQKWLLESTPGQHEKYLAYQSRYRAANAEEKRSAERLRYQRKKEAPEFAEKNRARMLKGKYGITVEDYDRMLVEQHGGCAICTRKPGDRPLHVDHCHRTGVVRGLLCHQCNWYLGTIEGGAGVFERLTDYLKKHNVLEKLEAQQS